MISFDIKGREVLVVGASSGIGRAISLGCCAAGAVVTSVARREELLAGLDREILSKGGGLHSYKVMDITAPSVVAAWLKETKQYDSVVVSVGLMEYGPAKFLTEERLYRLHSSNFLSVSSLVSGLIKHKKVRPGGSIVFIGSISSRLGALGTSSYAASKAALEAYARVLAGELAPQGIRVNTVLPGTIKTDAVVSNENLDLEILSRLEGRYPLGFGEVDDVAGAVIFLLSPAAKWISGIGLVVDGGFLLNR